MASECAAVLGATGGVGIHITRVLLGDPKVGRVIAASRRAIANVDEVFGPDAAESDKLEIVVVDYTDAAALESAFDGATVAYSGIGLYTKDARSEEHFRAVEIETNAAAAAVLTSLGVDRMAYLSGQGAKKDSWIMFARVKADAEDTLRSLDGMSKMVAARPGWIMGRGLAHHTFEAVASAVGFAGLLRSVGSACTAEEIAKAMVWSTIHDPAGAPDTLSNSDIISLARVYDNSVDTVSPSPSAL